MSRLRHHRHHLAGEVAAALGIPVRTHPPGTPTGGTAHIRSSLDGSYVDTRTSPATWARPLVDLSVVLIAPSGDWESAIDWLDEQVDVLLAAFKTRIVSVGGHGRLDSGSGQLVAIEVRFAPATLKECP